MPPMSTPLTMWAVLLATTPPSRILIRMASMCRIGYTGSTGRDCQAAVSSVTREIVADETRAP